MRACQRVFDCAATGMDEKSREFRDSGGEFYAVP